MPDYSDHTVVLQLLDDAQEADHDTRQNARDAHLFISKEDGMWEPYWWDTMEGSPRYTFDMTSPIIDQISGEMEQADFDIKIKPAGGDADKSTAKLFDGLIRNIENISNATDTYSAAGRSMVTGGIDGWRVVQKFVNDNSFDQDLIIEPIANFIDRVWFDAGSEMRDRSDARFCFVLQGLTQDEYDEMFPKGSGQSVDQNKFANAYFNKPDLIMVGEFYWRKETKRELVLMSNGATYEVDDDFELVADDLAALDVTEVNRRERVKHTVFTRKFDPSGWLSDAKETVFSWLPIIPTYGNFSVFENKSIYYGAVSKQMDLNRVLNYSLSREIAEGALAPRAKYWMTQAQTAGHEDTLATLNTNHDPIQIYNPDPTNPGVPQQNGGAQVNPGLRTISETMRGMSNQIAGLFAANMGDQAGLQSGIAIKRLQDKGDTGTIKWFKAQEVAICHTARILIDAIPRSYGGDRIVRILQEDGSFDMTQINQRVIDQATGQVVTLNDLSAGTYDATCQAGPSFKSRQDETVAAIAEMAQLDPSIIQVGADVLLHSASSPGLEVVAERKRAQLLQAGVIPESQWTDEEKQAAQEAAQAAEQQQQEPDAIMVAAQAEMAKAQAEASQAQAANDRNQLTLQKQQQDFEIKQQKQQLDNQKAQLDLQEKQAKFVQQKQQAEFDNSLRLQKQRADTVTQLLTNNKVSAETLKLIREAMGVDTIVGPHNQAAYIEQAAVLEESIDPVTPVL